MMSIDTMVIILFILGNVNKSKAEVCCSTLDDRDNCVSYYNEPNCTFEFCEESCGGTWSNYSGATVNCSSVTMNLIPVFKVRAPIQLISPASLVHGRALLMTRREVGIWRSVPIVGFVVSLFTPGYDEDKSEAALNEVKVANQNLLQVSSGLMTLKEATEIFMRTYEATVEKISARVDEISSDIDNLRLSVYSGYSTIMRRIVLLALGISATRAENNYVRMLDKQSRILELAQVDPVAQKLGKILTLCAYDNSLCIPDESETVTYYMTVLSYDDVYIQAQGYKTPIRAFVEVNVTRSPSVLSYLIEGDSHFYNYSTRVIAIGDTRRESQGKYCLQSLEDCLEETISLGVGTSEFYAASEYYYHESTYGWLPSVGSNPLISERNVAPACRNRENPLCCDDGESNYIYCAYNGSGRDPNIVGTKPATIWLPPNVSFPNGREIRDGSMQLGMTSKLILSHAISDIALPTGYLPYSVPFTNPIEPAMGLFTNKEYVLSERIRELLNSGNRQDNTAFAIPGEIQDMEVCMVSGNGEYVMCDPNLQSSTREILAWVAGDVPLRGWRKETSCSKAAYGFCCEDDVFYEGLRTVETVRAAVNYTDLIYKYDANYVSIYNLTKELSNYNSSLYNRSFNGYNLTSYVEEMNRNLTKAYSNLNITDNIVAKTIIELNKANKRIDDLLSGAALQKETDGLNTLGYIVAAFVLMGLVICAVLICYFAFRGRSKGVSAVQLA